MSNKVNSKSKTKTKVKSNKTENMDTENSNINKNMLPFFGKELVRKQIAGNVIEKVFEAIKTEFDIELDELYQKTLNCSYEDFSKDLAKARKKNYSKSKKLEHKFIPYKMDENGNFEIKNGNKIPLKTFEISNGTFNLKFYWKLVYKDYITEDDKMNEKYFRNGKFHNGNFSNDKFKSICKNTNSKVYKQLMKKAIKENDKIKKAIKFQEDLIGVIKKQSKTSAWIVYVKDYNIKHGNDEKFKSLKVTERMKYISKKWAKLTDEKKAKYEKIKDEINKKINTDINKSDYDKFTMRIIEYNQATSINNLSFYKNNRNTTTQNSTKTNDSDANDSDANDSDANDSDANDSDANDNDANDSDANDSDANDSDANDSDANDNDANDSDANDSDAENTNNDGEDNQLKNIVDIINNNNNDDDNDNDSGSNSDTDSD